ncbi:Cytochrome b5-like Heme/Steroid binding domain-containing protein [Giardia muris]|uniref:Cytochrome b5-like Heme/Steroid binding domain-containing protein n=1 Tax=Giardia muris TaxID=5742 RepID=A0A4Z1TC69_GIAMU|nr:Cytochrome b5-like Heme/Steroid binding domain-containing protein [Giardia muris]|eukprot:TNJ30071.1 Cytochrome b5-like Heme/Steroid binding domain-containing protein [Giardia muris]
MRVSGLDGVELEIPEPLLRHSTLPAHTQPNEVVLLRFTSDELSEVVGAAMAYVTTGVPLNMDARQRGCLVALGLEKLLETPMSQEPMNLPRITLEDLLVQDGTNGKHLWIAIDGVVFDVTDYLNKHPGGHMTLMRAAGQDSTELFLQHHGKRGNMRVLRRRLMQFAIGRLSERDAAQLPEYRHFTDTDANSPNPALLRMFRDIFGAP